MTMRKRWIAAFSGLSLMCLAGALVTSGARAETPPQAVGEIVAPAGDAPSSTAVEAVKNDAPKADAPKAETAKATPDGKITDKNHPDYVRCRSEPVLNSRAARVKICRTNKEWAQASREGSRQTQEFLNLGRPTQPTP
jgi:hypothetical protein